MNGKKIKTNTENGRDKYNMTNNGKPKRIKENN